MNKGFEIALAAALAAQGLVAAESPKRNNCDVLPKPKNVAVGPQISDERLCDEDEAPVVREQYEPMNGEHPIFEEKVSEAKVEKGALYREESELYIQLEPGFIPTGESIVDETNDAESPESES